MKIKTFCLRKRFFDMIRLSCILILPVPSIRINEFSVSEQDLEVIWRQYKHTQRVMSLSRRLWKNIFSHQPRANENISLRADNILQKSRLHITRIFYCDFFFLRFCWIKFFSIINSKEFFNASTKMAELRKTNE